MAVVQELNRQDNNASTAVLFTLLLLAPFPLYLNISYFNYFKGIFHTFGLYKLTYEPPLSLEQGKVDLSSAS